MSTLQHVFSAVEYHWPNIEKKWPSLSRYTDNTGKQRKPFMIMPAKTLKGMAPVYMKHLIDQDPSSYYMFIFADPLKGDCSRKTAHAFFKHVFYDILSLPSSYDIKSGYQPGPNDDPRMGTMSTDEAIDCEILPANTDKEYQDFYTEQMNKLKKMFSDEYKKQQKQAQIDKLGFDPDDGLTIDVDVETAQPDPTLPAASGQVGQSQQTGVGGLKKIWYAVDLHMPSGGMLGYKNDNFVSGAEDLQSLVFADIGNQLGFAGMNEAKKDDEDVEEPEEDTEDLDTPEDDAEEDFDEEPEDDAEDDFDEEPADEPEEDFGEEPVEEEPAEEEPEEDDDEDSIEGHLKSALSDIGSAMYMLRQQNQQDLEEEQLDPLNESIDPFAMTRWTYLSRD